MSAGSPINPSLANARLAQPDSAHLCTLCGDSSVACTGRSDDRVTLAVCPRCASVALPVLIAHAALETLRLSGVPPRFAELDAAAEKARAEFWRAATRAMAGE
jgi:hypothetical protein